MLEGYGNVPKKNLGRILEARRGQGWTNRALAARLGIGDKKAHCVGEWVSGKAYMPDKYIAAAARVLGFHPLVLLDYCPVGEVTGDALDMAAANAEIRRNIARLAKIVTDKDKTFIACHRVEDPYHDAYVDDSLLYITDATIRGALRPYHQSAHEDIEDYGLGYGEYEYGTGWKCPDGEYRLEGVIMEHNQRVVREFPADLRDLGPLMRAVYEDAEKATAGAGFGRDAVGLLTAIAREVSNS
jgi:hypothetical protein